VGPRNDENVQEARFTTNDRCKEEETTRQDPTRNVGFPYRGMLATVRTGLEN